jgi:hypothetical protein
MVQQQAAGRIILICMFVCLSCHSALMLDHAGDPDIRMTAMMQTLKKCSQHHLKPLCSTGLMDGIAHHLLHSCQLNLMA